MTKFIADRIRHHERNHVIRVSDVKDVTARRLLKDPRAVATTLDCLREGNPAFEIITGTEGLPELTRKEIQYHLGLKFKLNLLREQFPTLYNRLRRFGKPQDILREWGFDVQLGDNRLSRQTIRTRLWSLVNNKEDRRIIGLERRSPSTYAVIKRLARENGVTIKEYIEQELGFKYGKGK